MKIQRFGDALLRVGPSPLLPFLLPSFSSPAWRASGIGSVRRRNMLGSISSCRRLSSQTASLQYPAGTVAAEAQDEDGDGKRQLPEAGNPAPQLPPYLAADLPLSAASLAEQPRGPHGGSNAQAQDDIGEILGRWNHKPGERRRQPPPTLKGDAFRSAYGEDMRSNNPLRERQGRLALAYFDDADGPVDSASDAGSNYSLAPRPHDPFTAENLTKLVNRDMGSLSQPYRPPPAPVRLNAFLGRAESVDTAKGITLARALQKLDIKCAYNNVRGDHYRQRFHERPGLKRKRLKSERWRKRFKEGFQGVIEKVQNMRRKGW